MMRYPSFLKDEGSIGFVAPSFGCATQPYLAQFRSALKKLGDMGFHCALGPNCYLSEGTGISNTPEKCGEEINQAFLHGLGEVLISCGGGELMCEILDHVDFERIREETPKWFMGYSDNTNLTFLLPTLCDTAAIYGPCAGAFGMEPWHKSVRDAFMLLRGRKLVMESYEAWEKESLKTEDHPLVPYHVTEPSCIRPWPNLGGREEIRFSGRLLGGCLDCLVNLLGTRFDRVREFSDRYARDGIIWFWEACDLNVFAIRRAVWQMQHAGWFSHVKGFLIGRPLCHGQEMMGLDHIRAVTELLEGYGVPVILDVDLSHYPPLMPLICGSLAEVSCSCGPALESSPGGEKERDGGGSGPAPYRLKVEMKLA